jgi:hypothetical protein
MSFRPPERLADRVRRTVPEICYSSTLTLIRGAITDSSERIGVVGGFQAPAIRVGRYS